MAKVRNILFIMSDQLRWDYLSCYGHPHLKTPNIDRLAQRGVRFDRAYVQSPVCGPSRMSFYTGRTAFSHGATWNFVPLPVGELTLGDYLRPQGMRVSLVGKTHMSADQEGMARRGLSTDTELGKWVSECGFDPYERDDGEHPNQKVSPDLAYNNYLRSQGYDSLNPWNDFANAAEDEDGNVLDGWLLRNASRPARVREEHSETAYMTDRALEFMEEQGDAPWCLHLSYIKPHWPYIAPAPYHDMYGEADMLPLQRDERERENPQPVYGAFMNHTAGQAFSREEVCRTVIPAYMGLVKQIDDHLGQVFKYLDDSGRMDDTLIVFTSDHGNYLGDHWLGEKEMFHEQSVRIPLIIYDPDPAADATRGNSDDRFVEAIDLLPTFLEATGVPVPQHIVEGRSLLPLLRSEPVDDWRDAVYSELDYAFYKARLELKRGVNESRCFMIRTAHWKYVNYLGFRPQLFDLKHDPDEFNDLGDDPDHQQIRDEMQARLFDRLMRRKARVAMPNEAVEERTDGSRNVGVIIGEW